MPYTAAHAQFPAFHGSLSQLLGVRAAITGDVTVQTRQRPGSGFVGNCPPTNMRPEVTEYIPDINAQRRLQIAAKYALYCRL